MSFVAYSVQNVIQALIPALERGVEVRILWNVPSTMAEPECRFTGDLRKLLPRATFYEWDKSKTMGDLTHASVHANVQSQTEFSIYHKRQPQRSSDGRNMELGVLIHGGLLPKSLESHLIALETTRHLKVL